MSEESQEIASLGNLISALAAKTDAIGRAVQSNRAEVQATRFEVEKVQSLQYQTNQQIYSVQKQIAELAEGQTAKLEQLQSQLHVLQAQLASHNRLLAVFGSQLQTLLAANREEAALKRIETEKSLFLIKVRQAVAGIADSVIKYLFATRALEACSSRQISPEAFRDAANQIVVADIIAELRGTTGAASDSDRLEAALYDKIEKLAQELDVRYHAASRRESELPSLQAELLTLQAQNGNLAEKSKRERNWFRAGVVLTLIGIAICPLLVISIPLLVANWGLKAGALLKKKKELEYQIKRYQTAAVADAESVSTYLERLAMVGAGGPHLAKNIATIGLEDLNFAASDRLNAWIARHADVKYLIA